MDARPFDVYLTLCVLAQAAALVLAWRRRPYLFSVVQFAAADLLRCASAAGERPALLLVVAVLILPLVAVPAFCGARAWLGLGLPALVLLASGLLLAEGLRRMDSAELVPRPVVTDYWRAGDPLRVERTSVLLLPRYGRARLTGHEGPFRVDWPRHAGSMEAEILLQNAGPRDRWRVIEGNASLEDAGPSLMRLACRFGPAGGTVRVLGTPPEGDRRRVLLAAHAAGDLRLLARLCAAVSGDPPDLVVLLGDMVQGGDYAGLLALRRIVDELGTRVQYVPGEGERGAHGLRAFHTLFGGQQALRQSAGVAAVVLDSSRGSLAAFDPEGLSFVARMGGQLGTGAVILHHALLAPPGEERVLLATRDRARLLKLLPGWGTRFVATATDGPTYQVEHEGILHVAVGVRENGLEALELTLAGGRVENVRRLAVDRTSDLQSTLFVQWARLRAVSAGHRDLGLELMGGLAGVPGALLVLLLVLGVRARRRSHGRDGRAGRPGDGSGG